MSFVTLLYFTVFCTFLTVVGFAEAVLRFLAGTYSDLRADQLKRGIPRWYGYVTEKGWLWIRLPIKFFMSAVVVPGIGMLMLLGDGQKGLAVVYGIYWLYWVYFMWPSMKTYFVILITYSHLRKK